MPADFYKQLSYTTFVSFTENEEQKRLPSLTAVSEPGNLFQNKTISMVLTHVWMRSLMRLIFFSALFPSLTQAQPLQNRLMLATSRDGLNFTKTNTVIYNSADVPDAVVDSLGRVFLYFQGNQDPVQDVIMVGTSPDGVSGWSFQPANLQGIQSWKVRPCDPDVIYRSGVFRLYVTGDPADDHVPETYSLVSNDGINFMLESGVRFSGGTLSALDPSLLWIGDTLHYFAGGGGPDRNWHAVSTDGLSFTKLSDFSVNAMMMSNGIAVPGGYRFYGFPNKPPVNILSIFSADGQSWKADAGFRLSVTPNQYEGMYVKDPAIVLRDSLYLMYYVTRKPEYSAVDPKQAMLPGSMHLGQNYPNPFATKTTIPFTMKENVYVTLIIRDALGKTIARLFEAESVKGEYNIVFDASGLPAGVYLCLLQSSGATLVRDIIVVR